MSWRRTARSGSSSLEYAESIINTVREPLLVLDQNLRVVTVSRSFYDVFTAEPEDTVGQLIYDLGNKQWDIPRLRELLETILPEETTFDGYEVEHDFASIGKRTMLLNARQIQRKSGKERIILLAIEDITERKHLEEELGHMARRDPLTGVLNRYALEELLEQEAKRSERYAHSIGFLMIDVNRFKEVNDRFGHSMGDEVLQAMAAVIQANIRDADILVRYGGDEFLVILPETSGETDFVRERILADVARRNEKEPLLDFPVTLAIGSYHWSSESGMSIEEALSEADKLMYEDKRRSSASSNDLHPGDRS